MLDSLPSIFYHYDHEMRLRRWNKNHELVTGYSAAELTNKNPLEFFAEAERELVASRIVDIFGAGQSAVEANFMRQDGRTVPYLFTGVDLSHQDKANFVRIDIAELKKAREIAARENGTARSAGRELRGWYPRRGQCASKGNPKSTNDRTLEHP